MISAVNVMDYEDYRQFLHDWFWSSKKSNPKLSFRFVSKYLSLKAPNHFHLVITKRRHLSPRILEKVMRLIKLEARERQYLKTLFRENTAKDDAERNNLSAQRRLMKSAPLPDQTGADQLQLVGHVLAWYIKMGSLVFEGKTLEEIWKIVSEKSCFSISRDEFDAALDLLLKARQLEFENGLSRFEGGAIVTKWDFDSDQVKQHHRSNLNLALESIAWPVDRRFLTSVTVPCTEELYLSVIADVRALCLSVLEKSRAQTMGAADINKVATLQFALFPYFRF